MNTTESSLREVGSNVDVERGYTRILAELVGKDKVTCDSHFFDDLGANSLLMAQFCARVRKRDELPRVSIREVYRHPTIRDLAAALTDTGPADSPVEAPAAAGPARALRYHLCGVVQLLFFLAYTGFVAAVTSAGAAWITTGSDFTGYYLRSVVFGGALLVLAAVSPVAVKWILVGRWRPREIPAWSPAYLRFWIVKTLVQRNVLVLFFTGSPLYSCYLRALGAKVGRGVTVFSRTVPVCTDLLTIGEGTVIRKDCSFTGYRAQDGMIRTGAVTFGENVFVGEMTTVDIDTAMGAGSQLGHASSLHSGQAVPSGECWHGSPAQRADVDYRRAGSARCGSTWRAFYAIRQVLLIVAVYAPLAVGLADLVLERAPRLATLLGDSALLDFASWAFYRDALIVSLVLFFGLRFAGLLLAVTVPRLCKLALEPGKVYRLYGLRYSLHRTIRLLTNVTFFKVLFGDSSAIVHYLRALGCELSKAGQTGSNFGQQEKFESPYLLSVGSGTMIADGLSVVNADYSNTSFRLARASIGGRNFLGNHIVFPAGAKTGDNCLLATKVQVPLDGEVREGVGLLGSPSFEIPRTVDRDRRLAGPGTPAELRRGLAAKNRHNAATMVVYALAQWLYFFCVLLIAWATRDLFTGLGAPAIALGSVVTVVFTIVYFVLLERVATMLHPLEPLNCSIYDRRFWRHERFWKMSTTFYLQLLNGTPFKSVVWRMLGVRLGRRLFDDGCVMSEKTLVRIGDDVTLNAGSNIQCHSQEDGGFKLDGIVIGSGCTIGTGALVHYGVTMGEGAVLAPDSFLMKGEEVPGHTHWAGNPAGEVRELRVPRPRART
ncbi:Pls/PosA family non-ribosomal peptide synthetase [Amycolatopsis samaneae]|uniref:Pls/PosA family non-ribosomal peptide synthetase n=1 Tax=Amycolatopsis samaneae TaxID=664691 RepID=UPI003618A8BF